MDDVSIGRAYRVQWTGHCLALAAEEGRCRGLRTRRMAQNLKSLDSKYMPWHIQVMTKNFQNCWSKRENH